MQSISFIHYILVAVLLILPYYLIVKTIAKKMNIERLWFYVPAFFMLLPFLENLGKFLTGFGGIIGVLGNAALSCSTGLVFYFLFFGLPLGVAAIISLVQHIRGE